MYGLKCPALEQQWGPEPSIKELAMRKQTGRVHAEELEARIKQTAVFKEGVDSADSAARAAREGALRAQLNAAMTEQAAAKDNLMDMLQKQKVLLEPHLLGLNGRLQRLEQQSAQPLQVTPIAPPAAGTGWCLSMDGPIQPQFVPSQPVFDAGK